MSDPFKDASLSAESPASNAYAISPHVSNELPFVTRAVYIGGAGNITGRLVGDSADVTFTNVVAGTILPVRFRFIRTTSTATLMIGLY